MINHWLCKWLGAIRRYQKPRLTWFYDAIVVGQELLGTELTEEGSEETEEGSEETKEVSEETEEES